MAPKKATTSSPVQATPPAASTAAAGSKASPTAKAPAGSSSPAASSKVTAKAPAAAAAAAGKAGGKAAAGKLQAPSAAGKAKAAKAPTKASAAQDTAPAPAPVEDAPVLSEEEQRAKVQEALARAMADTEEVRKASWQQQVDADRRKEAARRKKAEEEARVKKEEARLRKACLEAAFDDESDKIASLMTEAEGKGIKAVCEFSDSHGNTLLSEATAGGALETVKLLLARGANPNTRGEFGRTPLWRAAFLGKAELVAPLLEAGADPRIGNDQGELPTHVATQPCIKEQLAAWDCSRTDQLVVQWEETQEKQRASAIQAVQAAVRGAQDVAVVAEETHVRCQNALRHARQELEKRIFEHDMCVEEKKADELLKATLESIHAAEGVVASAQVAARTAADALDTARLSLREQLQAEQLQAEQQSGLAEEEALPGTLVEIKALDEVLVRDVGGRLAASGRWPLLIDTSGQASVFLRYMDTNYVNALSCRDMEPDRLRRSILGGLRYGKPVVLDLMDVSSLWSEMPAAFDKVAPGLLKTLLDKSLLKNEAYRSLIKPTDGEEYDATRFQESRVARFSLIIHTNAVRPPQDLLDMTFPLRVNVKG